MSWRSNPRRAWLRSLRSPHAAPHEDSVTKFLKASSSRLRSVGSVAAVVLSTCRQSHAAFHAEPGTRARSLMDCSLALGHPRPLTGSIHSQVLSPESIFTEVLSVRHRLCRTNMPRHLPLLAHRVPRAKSRRGSAHTESKPRALLESFEKVRSEEISSCCVACCVACCVKPRHRNSLVSDCPTAQALGAFPFSALVPCQLRLGPSTCGSGTNFFAIEYRDIRAVSLRPLSCGAGVEFVLDSFDSKSESRLDRSLKVPDLCLLE